MSVNSPALSTAVQTRRTFLAALSAAALSRRALAQPLTRTPTFTVLSLFRPQRLVLHAGDASLDLQVDDQPLILRRGENLVVDAARNQLSIRNTTVKRLRILAASIFSLEVPNKLRRTYRGTLTIDNKAAHLRCVVGIERELAVASIVAAESPPHATPHALAAQAIAARSFLTGATTTHAGADFCDTTHCQFLREPPANDSPFARATRRTEGIVLQFRDPASDASTTLAAMYSRSCGGRTHTLAKLGLPARGYPYYAVDCAFCRAHPETWQRDVTANMPNNERARLDYNRIHGWSALPGHADSATPMHVQGRGVGHGIGLCQLGAADMAARGATFAEILTHYYPNTLLAHAT